MIDTVKPLPMTTSAKLAGAVDHNRPTNRLAILVATPWSGEEVMQHDIMAIVPALQRRGFVAENLLTLDRGPVTRRDVLDFLHQGSRRISGWSTGEVFLYVTGHGDFVGPDAESARLAVRLSAAEQPLGEVGIFWDEIFATFSVPAGVELTLLPDT
jgi:hypothetical protein